jgi:hypothetical protein
MTCLSSTYNFSFFGVEWNRVHYTEASTGLLYQCRTMMEQLKYSEITCTSAAVSTTNSTWPDPGHRSGKPATSPPRYSMVLWIYLLICPFRYRGYTALNGDWKNNHEMSAQHNHKESSWHNFVEISCPKPQFWDVHHLQSLKWHLQARADTFPTNFAFNQREYGSGAQWSIGVTI